MEVVRWSNCWGLRNFDPWRHKHWVSMPKVVAAVELDVVGLTNCHYTAMWVPYIYFHGDMNRAYSDDTQPGGTLELHFYAMSEEHTQGLVELDTLILVPL